MCEWAKLGYFFFSSQLGVLKERWAARPNQESRGCHELLEGEKYVILGPHFTTEKFDNAQKGSHVTLIIIWLALLFSFGINDQNELCFPKRKVVGILRQLPLKPTNIVWGFSKLATRRSGFKSSLTIYYIMNNQALPQSNLNFHLTAPPFLMNHLMSLCSTENVILRWLNDWFLSLDFPNCIFIEG